MQESYRLVAVKSIHSKKTDKYYHYAYVLFETDNSIDLLKVSIKEEQIDSLLEVLEDSDFDISKYLKVSYNTFTKQYQPTLSYGL